MTAPKDRDIASSHSRPSSHSSKRFRSYTHRLLRFRASIELFSRRLAHMTRQPIFIVLTVFGNLLILTSAWALYQIEHGINPNIASMVDTIWWAMATVTTVGYGDISPVTHGGKVVGIITMIFGAALFWSFTALFAQALISDEITDVESELRAIARSLERLTTQDLEKEVDLQKMIGELEARIESLRQRQNQPPTETTS